MNSRLELIPGAVLIGAVTTLLLGAVTTLLIDLSPLSGGFSR